MLSKIKAMLGSIFIRKPAPSPLDLLLRQMAEQAAALGEGTTILRHENGRLVLAPMSRAEAEKPTADADMPPGLVTGGWAQWRETMIRTAVPGWTFCRFAVRGMDPIETPRFFFGNVKGDYGVFTLEMRVCCDAEEEPDDWQPTAVLGHLVHIPTGVGIGIFASREIACRAADLIAPLFAPGIELDANAWGVDGRERVAKTLGFYGIVESEKWHCHPEGHVGTAIYEAGAAEVRPEKLS